MKESQMTTPIIKKLQPNDLIQLICYKAQPGVDAEQFIAAWRKTVEHDPAPAGLVYRELDQQVPEWCQLISREIQQPNPYTFIDYAVLSPDQDPEQLAPMPESITSQYEVVRANFKVDYRFVSLAKTGNPEMVLVNLYNVNGPPQAEQGFIMSWAPRGAYQSTQPGFYSAVMHHHLEPGSPISTFYRAEWESTDVYERAIDDFNNHFPPGMQSNIQAAGGRPPVTSRLGLYRNVASVTGTTQRAKMPMKAAFYQAYGGPEVLQYGDMERPLAGIGQILLQVRAVGVNLLDAKQRAGGVKNIQPAWFPDIPGYDLAGIVAGVGPGVTGFEVGQVVYGSNSPMIRRGYAEYAVGPANSFYRKPMNLDFVQAATIPSNALTAHNVLFRMAHLKAGQTVLIHGGSGSVGSFAVQFAKRAGAHVIATASTHNFDYVLSLGADEVIDYKTEQFEQLVSGVDIVFDTIGGATRSRSWNVIKDGGVLVTLVPPLPDPGPAGARGVIGMMNQNPMEAGGLLAEITMLIEEGQLQPPLLGKIMPLSEAAQAHMLLEQGVVKGKIVLEAFEHNTSNE